MKPCPQCRFENADHVRFCGGCGAALKTTVPGLALPPGDRTLVDQAPPRPPTTAGLGTTLVDAEADGIGARVLGLAGNKQQYEVIEEIGRGGMSVVYRARDRKLHREVALKRLLPQFTQRERAVARLMTEARSIANLQHPNIVSVFDIDQDEDGPYIAMEFVAGKDGKPQTLEQKVKQDGVLGERAAVELVLKLCGAVALAHSKKIIHRDIKPSNILLAPDGTPKLLDFGIAHAAGETVGQTLVGLTVDGSTLGTLDYMPPEQETDARRVDGRADIYALGGVLNFCLTGYSARHFRESSVPAELRGILSKALAHAPARRWPSAAELAQALQQAVARPTEGAPGPALKEYRLGPLEVTVRRIEIGSGDAAGLPPLPSEILELESQVLGLEEALRLLDSDQHPDLQKAQQAIQEAEKQERTLDKDVNEAAKNIPQLNAATSDQLQREISENPAGSLTRICARHGQIPGEALLPFLGRARDAALGQQVVESLRQQYDAGKAKERARLTGLLEPRRQELRGRQEQYFETTLGKLFENCGGAWEFPEKLWAGVEQTLLQRCHCWPAGELFRRAEGCFDEMVWKRTQKQGTQAGYENYLQGLPNGLHAAEARKTVDQFREEEDWRRLQASSGLPAARDFLGRWPQGRRAAEAEQLRDKWMEEAEWEELRKAPSLPSCAAFLDNWPKGHHYQDAVGLRAKLEQAAQADREEDAAWQTAQTAQTVVSCQGYLQRWPQGRHVPAAEQLARSIIRRRRVRTAKAALAALVVMLAAGWYWGRYLPEQQRQRQKAEQAVREATKEQPFVNSLGMKFVPAPGTKVLFCLWETRVKDYATYANANSGVDGSWRNPQHENVPVTPNENCPVVNVSWEDAKAFCRWLSEVERREGKLGPSRDYRLPTDLEWSAAVGLPNEARTTLSERNMKVKDVYPWGRQWPPPQGAGNFADESAKRKFSDWTIISGYDDGYPTTSPVGIFAANQYGLYDLAGNVWEWGEDFYDGRSGSRVLRGGSWYVRDPDLLLSSSRGRGAPVYRSNSVGFRVVLAGGSAP